MSAKQREKVVRRRGEICRHKRNTITSPKSKRKKNELNHKPEGKPRVLIYFAKCVTVRSIRSVNARLTGWTGNERNPGSLGNPVHERSQLEQMPSNIPGFTGVTPKRGRRVRWFGREDPDSGDPRSNGRAALGTLEHPPHYPPPAWILWAFCQCESHFECLKCIGISIVDCRKSIPTHLNPLIFDI